ncbi:MAG: hypothetical protein U5M23_02645 [Marinagarivorans sp.]|nr:hypothetical protein [Marinagarivorans sp.]
MGDQLGQYGAFKKRSQFKKFILSVGALAGTLVMVSHFAATHTHRFLDLFWLEEAHQAYLTTLVTARNDAWENHRTVIVCAANHLQNCVDINDASVTSWLAYTLSPADEKNFDTKKSPNAKNSLNTKKIIVAEHPFHAQYITFNVRGKILATQPTIGFDADGYSLQPQVYVFELNTLSQLSQKNYSVVVEPSGAVQSLAGRPSAPREMVSRIAINTPVEG